MSKPSDQFEKASAHFSDHICKIYDVLISLTERVEKIEKHLCQECNKKECEDE